MNTQLKISIVIACYNYAKYVAQAIESALDQAYPNLEVVVVNDGSRDESLSIIQRYADRVRIVDQANQGHISACNHGFSESTGDIVIFLDADDLIDPRTASEVARVWSPLCAKVQYDVRIIDAQGQDLGRRFCHFAADYDACRVSEEFKRTGTYRWPVTVGNAYSRAFLEQVMPLTVSEAPDGWLNTVAPVFGEIVTVPQVLGSYRVHGANLWSNTGADNAKLPKRIAHRRLEIEALRHWASVKGVAMPATDVLDHELPFINYRLMAKGLGLAYVGAEQESRASLVWAGWREALRQPIPVKQKLGHLGWFPLMALLPPTLLQPLIKLRYNRSVLIMDLRRRFNLLAG